MRKFSINRNKGKKNPTDEQIKRHKDFSRLSQDYQRLYKRPRKPLYKNPKLFLYLLLLGLILYLMFFESNK
jgi:hypothetical protein